MQEIHNRYPDYLVLRSSEDMDRYDDAIEAFAKGGSRSDLMVHLMRLGMTAEEIRWHAAYPGRRRVAIAPS